MNSENNINGIPNINDIKVEDTPAESFASIYGNGTQPQQATQQPMPVPPVQPAPVQQPMSVPPVQPAPVQQPMPVPPVQPAPVQQPMPVPEPQKAPSQPQVVEPIQPVQVDADRLQSIEEQLSKTSQYKPEDFQEEKIDIPTTTEYEKNKSGLSFVIAISIIILLFLIALPFITKFFS